MSWLIASFFEIAAIVCGIIILINAFEKSVWKGLFCLLCGPYGLYYAIFEFTHKDKWTIVLIALFGQCIAGSLWALNR